MRRRDCLAAGLGIASGSSALGAPAAVGSVVDWPSLTLLDGSQVDPATWRAQASVLVFWATWCQYCKRHNAHIDKLYRATRGQSLRVLGVALDTDAQAVRRYMTASGYAFPVALDSVGLRARLTARRVIPMTIVSDRQGRLVQAIPGEMSEDDVLGLGKV